MKVWVVYEEDRGMGVTIIGVYSDYDRAMKEKNGHCYIQEMLLDE